MNEKLKETIERAKKVVAEREKFWRQQERERQAREEEAFNVEVTQAKEWLEKNIYPMIEHAIINGHKSVYICEEQWNKIKGDNTFSLKALARAASWQVPGLSSTYRQSEDFVDGRDSESVTITWRE